MDSDDDYFDGIYQNKCPSISAKGIDFYMALITQRSPDIVYAFNTSFYLDLHKKGYDGVKDITKDIDIFSKQKLIIPFCLGEINEELYNRQMWTLIYVNFSLKFIKYYDTPGDGQGLEYLELIKDYLLKEFIDKKKKKNDFHLNDLKLEDMKQCRQLKHHQDNSILICRFAEFISTVVSKHSL